MYCPSDPAGGWMFTSANTYGITNYGLSEGIYDCCESSHRPITDIRDGTSSTIYMGEKSNTEPNFPLFAPYYPTASTPQLQQSPHGIAFVGSVWFTNYIYMQANVEINYSITPALIQQAAANSSAASTIANNRHHCYGSLHAGGANFSFADGSVRFIGDRITLITLKKLNTRNGGETISEDY